MTAALGRHANAPGATDQLVGSRTMEDHHRISTSIGDRQWQAERSRWLDEARRWQREHLDALAELLTLEAEVLAKGTTLRRHSQVVARQERDAAAHVEEYDTSSAAGNGYAALVAWRERQATEHTALRREHERIKQYHDAVTAQLSALKMTIESGFTEYPPEELERGLRHALRSLIPEEP